MRHLLWITVLLVGISAKSFAQNTTASVYLFEMRKLSDREYKFRNPRYLTDFNPYGYNNQPEFFSNGELAVTVKMPNENQTEIYLLDLYKKAKYKVTETIESEYSPTLMPDLFSFSGVRVETDGTQRLWQFPIDRLSNGKPVFKYIENVGYHQWINSGKVILFLVDDPNELVIADVATDEVKKLMSNVGRCFKVMPNGNLAFVHKVTPRTWYLKQLNVYDQTPRAETITTTLPGSEDFVVLDDGTFLMGSGTKLFKYNPVTDNDKGWREIADFRYYGIQQITRLALSKDGKLAVVSEGRTGTGF